MIETRMQWKAWIAFSDTSLGEGLASTIFHCLNFQQEMERDENPRPKLISPADITGKTKIYHTLAVWTRKKFFPLLIHPQGSQGCQNITFFFHK